MIILRFATQAQRDHKIIHARNFRVHPHAIMGSSMIEYVVGNLSMMGYTTKKDTSVTFWAERIFFCHTYDTSMTIIVTKPGIIIDVVGSYFYDKKS